MLQCMWLASELGCEAMLQCCNDIDECLRNNEEEEGNEAGFNLHDMPANYLF